MSYDDDVWIHSYETRNKIGRQLKKKWVEEDDVVSRDLYGLVLIVIEEI